MKDHVEMFEALLAGKLLINSLGQVIQLDKGIISIYKGSTLVPLKFDPKQWEVKVNTININGFNIPEPVKEPLEIGCVYYTPHLSPHYYLKDTWYEDPLDYFYLNNGLIQLTEEAAIQQAKAFISLTE
jgi:hypothetical protein